MKKVLVTGGFGYIGSHIVKELLKRSYYPIIIDNLSTSSGEIDFNSDKMSVYIQDIEDNVLLAKVIETHDPQAIIHTAGFSSIAESILNPHKYFCNNVHKFISSLKVIKDSNIKNFIYASSGAVYGNPFYIPIDEKHPTNPLSPYAYTKLVVEQILQTYEKTYGIKHVYLRFFNVSGLSMDGTLSTNRKLENNVIPLLIETALGRRKKFIVNGFNYNTKDGTVIRDYVHIDDIADAHVKALDYLFKDGKSDVFNIGTSKGYSILDLIGEVESVTKLKIPYEKKEKRFGDSPILVSDYTKAKEILNWQAKYNIQDMIRSLHTKMNSLDTHREIRK